MGGLVSCCKEGNCWLFCCKDENSSQLLDSNERTHLLVDPANSSLSIQRIQSDDLLAQYPNSLPKRTDEQSYLNKILHEAATNVIDVAALGPHNMEQNEYIERRSIYSKKLAGLNASHNYPPIAKPKCLLVDIPIPEKVLVGPAIPEADLILIQSAASRVKSAINEIKVTYIGELVVPFRIP